jgi:hypothetical protein
MTAYQRLSCLVCGAWLVLVAVALVNMSSVFSLLFCLLIFSAVWKVALKWPDLDQGLAVFFFYAALTLGLYEWQLITNPEYFGFSGGLGVGTDDSYFYSLVAPHLPAGFPVRDGYWILSHHYTDALRIFSAGLVSLNLDIHPLDFLFINVLCLSTVPFFARQVAFLATKDPEVGRFSFWFTLICPLLIANSLILVREGWLAMCFIGAIYFSMKRRYILLTLVLLGALYLRIEFGGLLAISIVAYFAMVDGKNYLLPGEEVPGWRSKKTIFTILITVIFLCAGAVVMIGLDRVVIIVGALVYRGDFLESFIGASNSDEGGGTFYRINQLPWFISIPLGFLFFLGSPFFTLSGVTHDGEYIPRAILSIIFSLMFIFYCSFFVRSLIRLMKSNSAAMGVLALIFLFDILILSQASMQIRHKVALMPLFYVIVAYGFVYRKVIPWSFGLAASAALMFVTIGVNAR